MKTSRQTIVVSLSAVLVLVGLAAANVSSRGESNLNSEDFVMSVNGTPAPSAPTR